MNRTHLYTEEEAVCLFYDSVSDTYESIDDVEKEVWLDDSN